MAILWKLLYNLHISVKYVTYAVLFLCLIFLLRLWSRYVIHYHANYTNILPGMRMFSDPNDETNLSYVPSKYILLWEGYYLIINSEGEQIFSNLQCRINNCIFTTDRYLFGDDYTRFDALLFSESALYTPDGRPEKRSRSQIYIFSTIESAYNKPACEVYNDNFFNWTFTYRLDSDILWTYFIVRNVTRHVVGPSINVRWQTNTKPISPTIKNILQQKTKAAAWLVSHCRADSLRDDYMTRLQEHLFHFSLKIDVYGGCSNTKCTDNDCEEMFTKDYYFYMAFENSFSEDYVSEKVLHGYNNYVVPIVYGGANYTRFLPPGSYLNAREYHPYNLAYIIHEAIKNPDKYEQYFKWTNLYTIDTELPSYHPLCSLCEALNSKKAKQTRTYRRFRVWWNTLNGMKWCLPEEYWNETALVNVDGGHVFDVY